MKKFEPFGIRLTRSEAKEIRGGQDYIEKPVTDPTDPGGGGGSGGCTSAMCDAGAQCNMSICGRPGWCTWTSNRTRCGCQPEV